MRTVIRTTKTTSTSSETMDMSIKAGWNGGFMTTSGGGGFTSALSSSQTSSLDAVEIYYSGQDRGTGVRSL